MKTFKVKYLALILSMVGLTTERVFAYNCVPLAQIISEVHDPSNDYLIEKYKKFYATTEHAAQQFFSMTEAEQKVLQTIQREGSDEASQKEILAHIYDSPSLSTKEKKSLIRKLGVDNRSASIAIENYRKNYEYFFWTDHSQVHMSDVLAAAKRHANVWPKEFVRPYDEVLQSPEWSKLTTKAISIHDSLMTEGRNEHAEALLRMDPKSFSEDWSPDEIRHASVMGFLHSKSLLPYAQLPKWDEVMIHKIIPHLEQQKILTPTAGAAWEKWLGSLNAADKKKIAKAAAWIRMADADRPIGAGLRNSIGDSFALNHDEVQIVHDGHAFRVNNGQVKELYGAVRLQNIQVLASENGFIAKFPVRATHEALTDLQNKLKPYPLLEWIHDGTWKQKIASLPIDAGTQSIAYNLASVLADFPPNSFQNIDLVQIH